MLYSGNPGIKTGELIEMGKKLKKNNISRKDEIINVLFCNNSQCASDFLRALREAIIEGHEEIELRLKAEAVFPNACVPIRGMIDHFSREGIVFSYKTDHDSYFEKCSFLSPLNRTREELQSEKQPFGKIFYYENPGQVADITQAFVDTISHQTVCGEGVLGGLTWCINEVMDNVLLHSNADHGLVMAQYHPTTQKVAFCIYDDGIGIYNSLKQSSHNPATELDAISLSLQEGVGDGKGQGNGMFGLYKIVRANKGTLTITSGHATIRLNEKGEMRKYDKVPYLSEDKRGTCVDFQLDLKRRIDLYRTFQTLGGIDDFDIRIDNMLDGDFYIYKVLENCQGTGTRQSGESIRNDVENIIKRINNGIVLDFCGVKMVSSSFIDEFIAKLVIDLGFIRFNTLIRIVNMETDVKFLCERSIYMRIHDNWIDSRSINTAGYKQM